jgi:hypothetical protein
MSIRGNAAVLDVETDTTELSTKLKQLRRLKSANDGPTISRHLQSALQEGKRKPGVKKADALSIFIGISIPTSE